MGDEEVTCRYVRRPADGWAWGRGAEEGGTGGDKGRSSYTILRERQRGSFTSSPLVNGNESIISNLEQLKYHRIKQDEAI